MRKIVYVSRARNKEQFSLPELAGLLRRARAVNDKHGVTGALFYDDGLFLQLLEGAPQAVEHVFERVRRDTRHEAVWVLCDAQTPAPKLFASWQMGFYHFSAIEPLLGTGLLPNSVDDLTTRLQDAGADDLAGRLVQGFWAANRGSFLKAMAPT